MGEKKAASEVDNTTDRETTVPELPADSLMKREVISVTTIVEEKCVVEETVCIRTSNDNMEVDSNEIEADKGDQLLEDSLDKDVDAHNDEKVDLSEKKDASDEVASQEHVEREELIKETSEKFDESKEAAQNVVVVVGEECENVDTIGKKNKSSDLVLRDSETLDDGAEGSVGESKVLAAHDVQVNAVRDEEKQSKETTNIVTENTKEISEDGQTKELAKDVNEEEMGENRNVSDREKGDDVEKEKNSVVQEDKGGISENEEMEIKSNLGEKSSAVENGVKTEEVGEKIIGEEGMGSKKRKREKTAVDTSKGKEKDEQDPMTPVNFGSARPVRQRKSVERLVASIEKDVIREIFVEKGPGVALKDIPNVASKLSKKRNDETFKQLHTILFGRRGKAIQMKNHVSQFSGFVWHDNEEKNKLKMKEKFDKLVKERLLEFCDVLDIPITNKVTTKKEDVVTKIMEFLAAPHATTDVLLSEKDQPEKSNKRKRSAGQDSTTPGSLKGSRKQRRKTSEKPKELVKQESDVAGESDKKNDGEVAKENNETGNVKQKQSEDESSEKSAGMEKPSKSADAVDETSKNHGQQLKKTSTKVESSDKKRTKPNTPVKTYINESEEESGQDAKTQKSPKQSAVKARSVRKTSKETDTPSKVGETTKSLPDTEKKALSSKATTGKKNHADNVKEKISVPSEPSVKKKTGPKTKPKEGKVKPSDKVLRDQICQTLKEVDFNTATFTDILKLLVKHFKTDLTPRKASIKLMIQEELTKMADDADEDEEEANDTPEELAKVNA